MFDDPAFLLINSKRHWVDYVLRSSTPEGLLRMISSLGWSLGSTENNVEVRVMAETDKNYTVLGGITLLEDSVGTARGKVFTFRTYGKNPYHSFIYDAPTLSISHLS